MAVCLDYQSVYAKNEAEKSYKFLIFSVILLIFSLIFLIWLKSQKTYLGYAIAEAQNKTAEYNTIKKELGIQLSILKKYDNLTTQARDRLGFVSKKSANISVIEY